jgi:VWFA-related protein
MTAILVAAALFAQDLPRFRAGVNIVRVDVGVVNAAGAVTGLEAADFEVRDNGEKVQVRNVVQEEAPLDIWLLFDVSGSLESAVSRVARSAREALGELRRGDRVGVAVFTARLRTIVEPTEDLKEVAYAIKYGVLKQPFSGGTHIQEAIHRLARPWSEESSDARRRAILVVTDNEGDRTMDDDEVTERLWRADAAACALVVPNGERRPRRKRGIDAIVEDTGCELVNTTAPESDFPALMKRIRNRYALFYALPAARAGEERRVEVKLTRDTRRRLGEVRVLARKGYVVPSADATDER